MGSGLDSLDNKGVVEHDVSIQAASFTLTARAGQTATGEFTFDKAGVYEFICSIPGHKERSAASGERRSVERMEHRPDSHRCTHDFSRWLRRTRRAMMIVYLTLTSVQLRDIEVMVAVGSGPGEA
jgi:hypothetical protein